MKFLNTLKLKIQRFGLFLFLLGVVHLYKAQDGIYNIDSLANIFVQQNSVDLKTFDLLVKELNQSYPDELAHLSETLLKRAVRENNKDGIHRAYDAFGLYYLSKGYYNQAFKLLFKSKKYYEQTQNLTYQMKNFYYIGRTYFSMGNMNEAILWMEKSIGLAENNPDRTTLYTVRNDLATVYYRASNYPKFKKLLDQNEAEWDYLTRELKVNLRTQQGNYLMINGKNDEAKKHYDEANKLAFETGNHIIIGTTYTNLAIYEFDYDIKKSKELFESSLRHAHLSNYADKISLDYYNLAFWFLGTDKIDSAFYYFQASYTSAKSVNNFNYMLDALEEMIAIERTREKWNSVDELHNLVRDIKSVQFKELMNSFDELASFENLGNIDQTTLNDKMHSGFSFFGLEKSVFWLIVSLITLVLVLFSALLIVMRVRY